jgi:predicted short-subunit dehydrogenase-like oxidoreductase (DUF2520 family)
VVISFVGAGALASGLAPLLRQKGCEIAEVVGRAGRASQRRAALLALRVGARAASLRTAELACDVLWLAVPDAEIAGVAREVACQVARRPAGRGVRPRVVLHASGALSSAVLGPLAALGVQTASAHPMMTFVAGEAPSLAGASFAVEGSAGAVRAARGLARRLGATSWVIRPEAKTLYHAFGAMLSPMLTAELEAAAQLGLRAGVGAGELRRIMRPIVERTVSNVLARGAAQALSGPLRRGDVATVAAHIKALGNAPEAEVYRALSSYACERLPVQRAGEMKKLLRKG